MPTVLRSHYSFVDRMITNAMFYLLINLLIFDIMEFAHVQNYFISIEITVVSHNNNYYIQFEQC